MKKFFLIFAIFFIASISMLGQTSLADTLTNGSDTLVVRKLWGVYISTTVTVENLGTGEDTLSLKAWKFIKNPTTGTVIDTARATPWIKDYEGSDVTILIVPEGATREFLILRPGLAQIEVALINTSAGDSRVIIEAWK